MESILKLYGPEGVYTEYKERLPSPKALAKTLVSLSNTKGGRIIIGVEDKTGNVVGLETIIDIEEYIMNVASENCEPIISPIVEMRSYKKKLVVVVDVPYGPLRPYHLRRMPVHESAYVRIGSTNRLADAPSIQQLMREAVHESFDRLLVPKTASRDLDWMKISQYQELKHKRLGTIKEKMSDSFAKKIGIKRHTSPSSPVTVGGLLLFGKSPQDLALLAKASIKMGRFKGRVLGQIIDHTLIEGTLDEQIEGAVQFIRKHTFVSGRIVDLKREDRPTYPLAALREAITNAVIHRCYPRAAAESIMCRMFDDRIEVESPGLLPLGVRVETLGEVQNTRNPLIAKLLFDMNYFDEWGQGIKRMIDSCVENGNPVPVFEEKDSTFKVILYARRERQLCSLKERRRILMNYLDREDDISSGEYQNLTGISPAQAAKDFNLFLQEALVRRFGKGRSVRYHKNIHETKDQERGA